MPAQQDSGDYTTIEQGIVKGRVTDAKGNPLANTKVVIENTILYASYVYAYTDAKGYYKTNVPIGSWTVSVQIKRNFLGTEYLFDLTPDNYNSFAGYTGAVRNLVWKLSGEKPQGGYYGNNVAVYADILNFMLLTDVELTLTPDGPLADGSTGQLIKGNLFDIGGGEYGLNDVPLGKYSITARNKATNEPLQIRLRNTGNYGNSITAVFKPLFSSTINQIVLEVN